jgi:hypothetical protein
MISVFGRIFIGAALVVTLVAGCRNPQISPESGRAPERILTLKKYRVGPISPTYDVEVMSDRTVIYRGAADVRLTGAHTYQLTAEKFSALTRYLDRPDFQNIKSIPDPLGHVADVVISARGGGNQMKSFNILIDSKSYFQVMRDLESFLQTSPLRCPHTVQIQDKAIEVCGLEKEMELRILDGGAK